MNETDNNLNPKCGSICITCLTTTCELYAMSFELKNEYRKFVDVVKDDSEIMICNMCCWQFRRSLKFKQQCIEASTLLNDAANMDLKYQKLSYCHNFETTKTEVYYFTENNGTHGSENQVKFSGYNSQENVSENLPDDIHDTEFNNDDEVPLVLLKDRRIKKRRKKKLRDNIASEPVEDQAVPSKKAKKELKEGFTSRMVQETDEYVVIKLTKEQVLQEMEERSKTEAYLQSLFKCDKCVKGFNFQDVLQTHMEKHTEIGLFQCDMCSQYCRSAVSLRGHVKSHTTRYKCKLCGVVRLSRQHLLEHHAITHTRQAVTYSCDTCQFNTNKRTVMQRHVKSHVRSEPHACEQCGKLFKSIDSLRVHTMRHDKSSRLQCHCGVSFVYHSLLRRHVTRVHERREYYCVECDAQFKSNESLRLHFKKAKIHRDSSTFKHACPQCALRFASRGALQAHGARAHGAPRAHACAACRPRRLYSSRDALRAHAYRAHNPRNTKAS